MGSESPGWDIPGIKGTKRHQKENASEEEEDADHLIHGALSRSMHQGILQEGCGSWQSSVIAG
jgi:hypothetical protein